MHKLYTVQYTMHNVHNIYIVHYTMYSVYTVSNVQFTLDYVYYELQWLLDNDLSNMHVTSSFSRI